MTKCGGREFYNKEGERGVGKETGTERVGDK